MKNNIEIVVDNLTKKKATSWAKVLKTNNPSIEVLLSENYPKRYKITKIRESS